MTAPIAPKPRFGRMNPYQYWLDEIVDRDGISLASLKIVLRPLEEAVQSLRVRDPGPTKDPSDEEELERHAAFYEEVCADIEDLLGASFVLSQRQLTRVVSAVKELQRRSLHRFLGSQRRLAIAFQHDTGVERFVTQGVDSVLNFVEARGLLNDSSSRLGFDPSETCSLR